MVLSNGEASRVSGGALMFCGIIIVLFCLLQTSDVHKKLLCKATIPGSLGIMVHHSRTPLLAYCSYDAATYKIAGCGQAPGDKKIENNIDRQQHEE